MSSIRALLAIAALALFAGCATIDHTSAAGASRADRDFEQHQRKTEQTIRAIESRVSNVPES